MAGRVRMQAPAPPPRAGRARRRSAGAASPGGATLARDCSGLLGRRSGRTSSREQRLALHAPRLAARGSARVARLSPRRAAREPYGARLLARVLGRAQRSAHLGTRHHAKGQYRRTPRQESGGNSKSKIRSVEHSNDRTAACARASARVHPRSTVRLRHPLLRVVPCSPRERSSAPAAVPAGACACAASPQLPHAAVRLPPPASRLVSLTQPQSTPSFWRAWRA